MVDRIQREPEDGDIARLGMMRVIEDQQNRISVLQTYADEHGRRWLAKLSIMSVDDAAVAENTYTGEWFDAQPYSRGLKRLIAEKLLELTENYPVSTTTWTYIVGENA